jgi:hypothetical protein
MTGMNDTYRRLRPEREEQLRQRFGAVLELSYGPLVRE